MTTTSLPNRPANPADISFDRECFEIVGERVEYVVQRLAPLYPLVFDSRKEAEATGGRVRVRRTPIRKRVRWN